jgi:hypothetical protein
MKTQQRTTLPNARSIPWGSGLTKSELKGMLVEAAMSAIMSAIMSLPLGVHPKVQAFSKDETVVNDVMEEDGKDCFFIKVTL